MFHAEFSATGMPPVSGLTNPFSSTAMSSGTLIPSILALNGEAICACHVPHSGEFSRFRLERGEYKQSRMPKR